MYEMTRESPMNMARREPRLQNGWFFAIIPAVTDVCTEVTDIVENPKSTARELAQVICASGQHSERILRAANSAFNSLETPVQCLRRAIVLLGLYRVRDIVLGSVRRHSRHLAR